MDLEVEAKDLIAIMLQNRIDELEKIIEEKEKKERSRIDELEKIIEEKERSESKEKPELKIPSHLSPVMQKHLPKLRGYRMKYNSEPNGACLDNCVAVHVYEDEEEASKLKKRINNHVADNWDNYYQNKIPLPYEETSGVGEYAK